MSRGFILGSDFEEAYAPLQKVKDGLTAFSGGGQASATSLPASISRVTTVAVANDSVKLPASAGLTGLTILVINATANSMNVYPATGEAIDNLGANAAKAVAGNKSCDSA
jgi:hypothetical protein